MIVGSGLLAKAFAPRYRWSTRVCIYAAGVSNSTCVDGREFARERERLTQALAAGAQVDRFVYFSTCSVADPAAAATQYVRHKLAMEELVSRHPGFLVARLPQVAGRTPNPHTLLNYLYARISRSESFQVWNRATRNIIDVDDVVAIVSELIEGPGAARAIVNVANPVSYPVLEIVAAMEQVTGKPAVHALIEDGAAYAIDTSLIAPIIGKLGLAFDDQYLVRVARKYYANPLPHEH
jgi:nucleoside-diphosphate-sugar epimerase